MFVKLKAICDLMHEKETNTYHDFSSWGQFEKGPCSIWHFSYWCPMVLLYHLGCLGSYSCFPQGPFHQSHQTWYLISILICTNRLELCLQKVLI